MRFLNEEHYSNYKQLISVECNYISSSEYRRALYIAATPIVFNVYKEYMLNFEKYNLFNTLSPIMDTVTYSIYGDTMTDKEKQNYEYVANILTGIRCYLLCELSASSFNSSYGVNIYSLIKEFKISEFDIPMPEYLMLVNELITEEF
ncbi:hypothetical protein DRW41_03710 [Neobacillus piezotolerans]|uniref:Uncharacterized protein n=1 Tax=Neobacillus piezotolerans TaxID=2259171 RepID=A0A3D8GW36_9BACI|nr:hypothetical protein DRW41_03710 [Neobacillus piezotolerans]